MMENLYKALEVSGIGLAGVFVFMVLFFFVVRGIDKLFPHHNKDPENSENGSEQQ